MQKLRIDNLQIDLTRRCNFRCKHCMRGDSQNMDMAPETIRRFFSLVSEVNTLLISGGEPSLNICGMNALYSAITENNISINRLNITTNAATEQIQNFMQIVERILKLCKRQSECAIGVSVDVYHGDGSADENYLHSFLRYHRLKRSTGMNIQPQAMGINKHLKGVGRAATFTNIKPWIVPLQAYSPVFIHDNTISRICLNTNGNIGLDNNIPYTDCDKTENIICNLKEIETSDSLIGFIEQWNTRKHVVTLGMLQYLGLQLRGRCAGCPYAVDQLQNRINMMSQIIESDLFRALPEEHKAYILDVIDWDHKRQCVTNVPVNPNACACPWYKFPEKRICNL